MFTILRTWHYGNDYSVTLHAGASVRDALIAAAPDMPWTRYSECLLVLCEGDAYAGWSWMRLELV